MGAQVQVNGVTTRSATVPFGVPVTLLNAVPTGTAQKWEVLDYGLDLDDAGPDFATNFASWTAAGDGSYFVNQVAGPFSAVTFVPDVTGTYVIKLTSTESGGAVNVQVAVVRVKDIYSGELEPGAGEDTEGDSRVGWRKVMNRLKRDSRRAQGYIRVANVSGGTIARGKVVKIIGTVDGHTVSPNVNPGGTAAAKREKVFTISVADNTAAGAANADYAILDESLPNNSLGWAQKFGLFQGQADVNYTGFTVGNTVFFDAAGNQVNAAPGAGQAIPIGVLLENGSAGSISVGLAGKSVNELITGRPGGNLITFGTNAGDGGTITTTSHATKGTLTIGAPTAIMTILENLNVSSAVGAVLDVVSIPGATVTIGSNNNINTAGGFNYVAVYPPTYSAALNLTIASAATMAVMGPPVLGGLGPAIASNITAFRVGGTWSHTANTGHGIRLTPTFAPSSGNGTFNAVTVEYTVNQTGGASGTVRGYYSNATETTLVGTHNLAEWQVAGVAKFVVTNAGVVAGGTTASANLPFASTTNATKGKLIFGSAGTSVYDEANSRWGFGTATPSSSYDVHISRSLSGNPIGLLVDNSNTGGSALLTVGNSSALRQLNVETFGGTAAGTYAGINKAFMSRITSANQTAFVIGTQSVGGAHDLVFVTNDLERARILSTGEFVHSTTVVGSTSTAGTLTLSSTTNGTKGFVQFGSSTGLVWDETNKALGIGKTPAVAQNLVVDATAAAGSSYQFATSSGKSTLKSVSAGEGAASLIATGTTAITLMGLAAARSALLELGGQTAPGFGGVYTPGAIDLVFGTNSLERARFDSLGNMFLGKAALTTTATDGFPYIPTCAGPPTGVPTGKTGMVPFIYDATNNKWYVYNAGWKGGTAPGTWS
jgi:hypothetical protein